MDLFLDDLVDGLVHQVQENVVGRVEKAALKATERLKTTTAVSDLLPIHLMKEAGAQLQKAKKKPPPPPSNTDILYLTERLLVSSQPAIAAEPTYRDVGRDVVRDVVDIPSSIIRAKRKYGQTVNPESDSLLPSLTPLRDSPLVPSKAVKLKDLTEKPEFGHDDGNEEILHEHSTAPLNDVGLVARNTGTEPMGENLQDGGSKMDGNDGETTEEPQQSGTAVVVSESGSLMSPEEPSCHDGVTILRQTALGDGDPTLEGSETPQSCHENSGEETMAVYREHDVSSDGCAAEKEMRIGEEKQDVVVAGLIGRDHLQPATAGATMVDIVSPVEKNPDISNESTNPQFSHQEKFQGQYDSHGSDIRSESVELSKELENDRRPELPPCPDSEYNNDSDSHYPPFRASTGAGAIHSTNVEEGDADEKPPDFAIASEIRDPEIEKKQQQEQQFDAPPKQQQRVPIGPIKNSPGNMVTYLDQRHRNYLACSLTNEPPDDRTLLLFRRQIVQLGWWSPCMDRSETPSISRMLKACYAIHAYLQLDPSNVVLVYCANGKTRTAIVAACYLRFSGMVRGTEEGFLYFLSKRGIPNPREVFEQVPPSLKLFFHQFDKVLDLGCFLNRKPLLLRAIALQGVPVEDQPCLDIWDSSQQHVYSSHPEMWQHDTSLQRCVANKQGSQWADEEGFYKVNAIIDGEFLLLCRFGGDFARETNIHDPSKILFRYTNTTGFLSGGCPYELTSKQVDLMRRYSKNFDEDEFLVTFLFEADWEQLEEDEESEIPEAVASRLKRTSAICGERVWRCHEEESCEEGWKVIFATHSAQPADPDIVAFKQFGRDHNIADCSNHLIALALKLTNFNFKKAMSLLLASPSFSWWQDFQSSDGTSQYWENGQDEKLDMKSHVADKPGEGSAQVVLAFEERAALDVLSILDKIDVSANLEQPDLKRLELRNAVNESYHGRSPDPIRVAVNGLERQPSLGGMCLQDSGWLLPTIMYPQPGEVVRSFEFSQHRNVSRSLDSSLLKANSSSAPEHKPRPKLPYYPRSKPGMPLPLVASSRTDRVADIQNYNFPGDDLTFKAAQEVFAHLRHTGVTLEGLMELTENSRTWMEGHPATVEEPVPSNTPEAEIVEEPATVESRESSMNQEAKEKKEKKWKEDQKAEAIEKQKASGKKRLTHDGLNQEDDNTLHEVPLKDDPEYTKYFKMLKLGMAKEQVLHAMKRDGKDPMILDLDPNKSLDSQILDDGDTSPLERHKEYAKYFKMMKMGMPKEQVKHAMKRDGKDHSILDLDPSQSLKSQQDVGDSPPLKDDPEYAKYFKMLQMGLPREQVVHAMTRDGKDVKILDLDPTKSIRSQQVLGGDDGPPLKDDPEYAKYFKMLKMGMPKEQVVHAMTRDEKDIKVLDMDPTRSLKSQQVAEDNGSPPLKDDPEYAKYFKMLAMKLPIGAVKNALQRDGKDPAVMDLDPNRSVKSQLGGASSNVLEDMGPPLKEDPEYAKYFKMLSMKLPMGAVKNALMRDGKDPAIMDLDPNKSVKLQLGGAAAEVKDVGIPLKDDPEYSKYFKMEKMGLPRDAVKNALVRDGKDPGIMDLDPNKSMAFQMAKTAPGGAKKVAKKKKKVRRKKIYWNPIDPGKLKEDSMWNIVRDYVAMDKLNYDEKEFAELFTESAEPSDKKTKKEPQKETKKLVQVIDPKRSMNGGIVLARLKTDHVKVAEHVNKMEHGKFDSTQLKALKEYLADADERRGLIVYMKKGEKSEEIRKQLYADLSETEKYMVTLMDVPDAGAKLDAMLFRSVFTNRFEDITDATRTLNSACDELRSSEKLRKLMAMILTVVNQINTGGEGKLAMGFTLDALLKLNEAKAFDKKTSVLHYVVKLVKKNDEALLSFENDIVHVIPAESVLLDSLAGEVKAISDELDSVLEIVQKEADRMEGAGELKKMSLADLSEQRTIVQHIGSVPQFNKIAHLTGRTSMERFTLNAKVACDQAAESIENVKKKYAMVLGYFGEDENMPTGDFFGILRRFMTEWKKATDQVEKIELAEAKERKKAANRAAKEEKKKKSRKSSRNANGENEVLGRSDIATMARLAANGGQRSRNENKLGIPLGGLQGSETIGAAAAAAARLKSDKASSAAHPIVPPGPSPIDLVKESVVPPETTSIGPTAGIAGAAALAAIQKAKKQNDASDLGFTASRPEGIAAAASKGASRKVSTGALTLNIGATSQNDHTRQHAKSSNASLHRMSEHDVFDDKGGPVNLDEPDPAKLYENEEPVGQDLAESAEKEERTRKSAFAAKAAAYRRRKGNKDGKEISHDDGQGPKIESLQSPYRNNTKAERDVEIVGDELNVTPADDTEIIMKTLRGLIAAAPAHEEAESSLPSKQEVTSDAPSRMPTSNEVSLSAFLERGQGNQGRPVSKTKVEPPSLGNFFERQVSHEIRTELLRQNYDDSSVAIMADRFEKKAIDGPTNWNEGGGISDFIGWANQAIQASDTESVRGFEISRNLDDHHDFDDDSTIATYYDDDASIVSSSMMTPMQRDGPYVSFGQFGDFGQGDTSHSYDQGTRLPYDAQYDARYETQIDDQYGGEYDDNVPSVTAKVAASILFNDSETDSSVENSHTAPTGGVRSNAILGRDSELVDMALTFNDVGLDAGLSFGADVGFDDGLGFGGIDDGLSGFGVPSSQGHGMPSSLLSYGDQHGVDSFGDDGGMSDKRKSGSKWFQWGKGK